MAEEAGMLSGRDRNGIGESGEDGVNRESEAGSKGGKKEDIVEGEMRKED